MVRIGGFRDAADAAVARSVLEANGIAARVVVDEAFGLHPAGNWEASLEVADDERDVALQLLAVEPEVSRSPAAAGFDGTAPSAGRPRSIAAA